MSWVCITTVTGPFVGPVLYSTDMGLTRVPHMFTGQHRHMLLARHCGDTRHALIFECRTLSHRYLLRSAHTYLTVVDLCVRIAFVPARTVRGLVPLNQFGTAHCQHDIGVPPSQDGCYCWVYTFSHVSRTCHMIFQQRRVYLAQTAVLRQACNQGCPFPYGAGGPLLPSCAHTIHAIPIRSLPL